MSSSSANDDKKPADASAHINVKVEGQKQFDSSDWRLVVAMSSAKDDKKPADAAAAHINLKVEGQFHSGDWRLVVAMSSAKDDKKPADAAAHINLKVMGQDGCEVFFRIKRSAQLKKLMRLYCERRSVNFNSIVFVFGGRRFRGEQTPDELEMEDGDEINALFNLHGSSWW